MGKKASSELNEKELKVLEAFGKVDSVKTIEELARESFDVKRYGASPTTRGNSWVRNSLRKLLRLKLVKGGDRSGKYTRTALKVDDLPKDKPKEAKAAKTPKKAKEPKAAKAPKKPKEPKAAKAAKPPKVAKPRKPRAAKAPKPAADKPAESPTASEEKAAESAA
jgi:hypothetical protein